jgi:RNA recognition motif-containing protein
MKSRDNRALKWDDLLAENFALQNQKDEVTNTLSAIERDKQRLMTAIYNKSLERARRIDQRLSNVSKFIVQHPEDTITHLQETFGDLGTHKPDENKTINHSSDSQAPSTSSSGNSSQSKDPLESLYMKNAIYVTNLTPGLKWSDLARFCNKYGSIKQILKKSSKSTSAVVVFYTTDEARLALEALNGQMLRLWYIEGHQQIKKVSRLEVQYAPLAVCKGYKFLDI